MALKTCVYLEDPKAVELVKKYVAEKRWDNGVVCDKVDNDLKLPHDDLARAMYYSQTSISIREGKLNGSGEVICPVLAVAHKELLKDAYINGEIDRKYLETWMLDKDLKPLDEARAKAR